MSGFNYFVCLLFFNIEIPPHKLLKPLVFLIVKIPFLGALVLMSMNYDILLLFSCLFPVM